MADPKLAHPANVPGEFFVDTNCINCPTCRQIAPTIFGDADGQPVVVRQPVSDEEKLATLVALVSSRRPPSERARLSMWHRP